MLSRRLFQTILRSSRPIRSHLIDRSLTSSIWVPCVISTSRFVTSYRNQTESTEDFARKKLTSDGNRRKLSNKVATIPNVLCLFRIGLTPVIGYLVVTGSNLTSLAAFVTAGVTDWLDGYIARNFPGQKSLIGSIIDPLADKLLITTLFITLTYVKLLPLPLTILVILRDIGLIFGAAFIRYKSMQRPVTLLRYFNLSISPLQVKPTVVSKINTALQMCTVASSLAAPAFNFIGHPFLNYICLTTAATTIFSGLQYARLSRIKPVDKS
ncbi:unnamed protein product [Thelazia callipaeda]|uniref:cardiolipin synthase (CMP-forming) n=1 Tax=Thelazia callipaeda TaxID=103827 RepID=A0A0N5DBN5_THECL|nr:unnamed protein product [Thelazia callipaeda]